MTLGVVGRKVGMTQIFTENGERIPVTLVETGPVTVVQVGLMSMGAVAKRDGIDLTNAVVEVELVGTPPPKIGYSAVNAIISMPPGIDPGDRDKLERAADACPIKHSLNPNIDVSVLFEYDKGHPSSVKLATRSDSYRLRGCL